MEFIGKLNKKHERSGVTKDGVAWKCATYQVIEVKENPQSIVFDVFDGEKGRIKTFDEYEDKPCKVYIDFHTRIYGGRYYNDVRGWSVTGV